MEDKVEVKAEDKAVVDQTILYATGRRKEATAKVWLFTPGTGEFKVNGRKADSYFVTIDQKTLASRPLVAIESAAKFDVKAKVMGGGINGQAGAVSLGIARCLIKLDPALRLTLKKDSLLTRDPRTRERKKYGRKGARRRFQWTKR